MLVTVGIVSSPIKFDQFMHAADAFEPSKRLASLWWMEVKVKAAETARSLKLTQTIWDAVQSSGVEVPIAVFVPYVQDTALIDGSVISISDGQRWGLFGDLLRPYGIMARREIDQQAHEMEEEYRPLPT